jgi:hypothetical protein
MIFWEGHPKAGARPRLIFKCKKSTRPCLRTIGSHPCTLAEPNAPLRGRLNSRDGPSAPHKATNHGVFGTKPQVEQASAEPLVTSCISLLGRLASTSVVQCTKERISASASLSLCLAEYIRCQSESRPRLPLSSRIVPSHQSFLHRRNSKNPL